MDPESELVSLIAQVIYLNRSSGLLLRGEEVTRALIKTISFISSMDFDSMPKPQSELISITAQIVALVSSMSDSAPESKLISLINQQLALVSSGSGLYPQVHLEELTKKLTFLRPKPELISLMHKIVSLVLAMDSELKLIVLINYIASASRTVTPTDLGLPPGFISIIIKLISLIISLDLDSQPKPESKLMSLITQTVSLFNSLDLDSLPKPLSALISFMSQKISLVYSAYSDSDLEFLSLVRQTLSLEPEPEFVSLIREILCLVKFMNLEWRELIPVSPQAQVRWKNGRFHLEELAWSRVDKWNCFFGFKGGCKVSPPDSTSTFFYCKSCNGECHKDNEKVPVKIKHPLHPKHFLQLVLDCDQTKTRECYCCDADLEDVFYYCSACDFSMNIACVEKPLVLSIDQPKWHDHTLALFPSQASFPCNLCALTDSTSCPFYICPPCDFVVHQSCFSLPRVIRISRHLHRISFTHSFDQGDWSCGVCRKKINNDYGGYSCTKDGCSYGAHSKCATRSNVWDGIDLEGEPEEVEEEVEPFVRISDGIIQHFSHEHHHLTLDENTCRDYDEDKLCHACIMPIYFGNFYFCITCEFILHESCANLSRKLYHPIHPHLLTLDLVRGNDNVDLHNLCSACAMKCTDGFFYECGKEGCNFNLHVQCATTYEPLVHQSHSHPLFLTSKPDEKRDCSVCKRSRAFSTKETFNCNECHDFALCFECATIPEKVRYKHDKHILTLSYGEETSNETYWCEACERKINPKERFYTCDEYCCVTLHIDCLIGRDLYMKPGSTRNDWSFGFDVIRNNHMTRPTCSICKQRCQFTTALVFRRDGSITCSLRCSSHPILRQ